MLQLFYKDEHIYCVENKHFWHWEQTSLMLEIKVFCAADKQFSTGEEHIENMHLKFFHTHTRTQLATSDLRTKRRDNIYRYSPPKTGGITLLYSPPSMLGPQIIHTQ